MSDRSQLLDAFSRGALIRPSPEHMGFVDVVRAVASACGVPRELGEHTRILASHLQDVEHIIFLLVDGLGIDLVDRMSRQSWLRRHTRRAIQAPFPSTTTTAVTSFCTAEHPAQHAVCGWWVHLAQVEGPATVFAHDRAVDNRSLHDLGIGVEAIYSIPPILDQMTRDAALLIPEAIADSPFTVHMAGARPRIGYKGLGDAVEALLTRISSASGPTFTYWYTPSPDSESHDEGTQGDAVFRALETLDTHLAQLEVGLRNVGDSWRIVGTADHGHLELDPRLELEQDDAILAQLRFPPSGDMRVQYWHVREGQAERFAGAFRRRFGDGFYLLTAQEVEELGLFGPAPWSEEMRRRSGDFVSISRGRAALRYAGIPGNTGYRRMRSGHSGLSPAEMRVPLILAGEETTPVDYA